ncbi:bifunctional diguanylate cyclase/phosphodiesterase [Paenibacillus lutrae]|uniref:EAL domain-containing protein n=1 Tax=Paenibacillus lutrae TaxID=2078573 RepID=A0A7X3FJ64_9BACL|nr:bifunctional diguanylate cyclase/phosphodiesterase [Paenibacillus lutrae]MVP00641.1 EAL domain-containing protein [Paenibacillus lutrae]
MEHLHGTYNSWLVGLSFLIAVTAAYSALDLAERVSTAKGRARPVWLLCGAISMGLGIWSMHFVGMLAYSLPLEVSYEIDYVLLSILLAVSVSAIALYVVGQSEMGVKHLLIGGTLMAAGISGMHYIGMAAMVVNIQYNPRVVLLSVLIAAAASFAALWLLFYFRKKHTGHVVLYKLCSGLIMGAAIAGMHYTGMAAARFYPQDLTQVSQDLLFDSKVLAYAIAAGTLVLLGMTLLGILVNKRLSQKDLALQEHERWYRSLYENNSDGIISVDTGGRIIGFNPAVTQMTGLNESDYMQGHISALGLSLPEEEKGHTRHETALVRASGEKIELAILNVPVEIEGKRVGNHIIAKDITEEKRSKERIRHLAYHDELTGLPNRRHFNDKLVQRISLPDSEAEPFAVLMVDIDRFKFINDSLGHTYGDLFLQMVSERMRRSIEGSGVFLARMGGDEFTFISPIRTPGEEPAELIGQIIQSLQAPYRLKDNDFYVTASIGIALYPEHGKDPVQLLKNADTAMYEVKKREKNGHLLFSNELDKRILERLELENDLRKAVQRQELVLHYQPQISTKNSRMIGVEALVRWKHPVRGMISPVVFVPIAEESGMILEIGTWVLREACLQMSRWHQAGGPLIPVSVNLSAQQFHHSNLVDAVKSILLETGLQPQYLELEITEGMMMDHAVSSAILQEISELGVRISLDDFGTGYSSLSYLKQFPIHKLKIDRSFITDITNNPSDQAIVATIISMANHLKLDVIAEGIETKDQLDILTEKECREIQGYYFSKPLPANEVEESFFVPQRIPV